MSKKKALSTAADIDIGISQEQRKKIADGLRNLCKTPLLRPSTDYSIDGAAQV